MLRALRDRSFQIPRPQRDRVNFRRLAAIAATCLSVGVALSGALREPRHGARQLHESAEQDVTWQEAGLAAEPTLQAVQQLQALVESGLTPNTVETETSISAALASPPAAASPAPLPAAEVSKRERAPKLQHKRANAAATARDRSELEPFKVALQRGAASYHCDTNTAPAAKRSKCPRDRTLEARVWRVLARLTSCRDVTSTLGRAELRLRFAPDASTHASLSAPAIAQSLNLRAVSQCVAGELSNLKATRKVDRFELEIGFGLTGHN